VTDGIFARLGPALEREALNRPLSPVELSPVDMTVILLSAGLALITYGVYFSPLRALPDTFFQVHAFSPYAERRPPIDPALLARCRLAQVILLHPDRFSYAFSGKVLIVTAEKRKQVPALCPAPTPEDGIEAPVADHASAPEDMIEAPATDHDSAPEDGIEAPVADHTSENTEETRTALEELQEPEESRKSIEEELELCIFIGQTISFFLREKKELALQQPKRGIEISLDHEAYQAIFAYLTIQGIGTWVTRDKFLELIYSYLVDEKGSRQQTFNTHISRIRHQIRACIKEHFPAWAAQAQEFGIFGQKKRGRESLWCLLPCCRVIGIEQLQKAYRSIQELKTGSRTSHVRAMSEEKLYEMAWQLIKRYSGNYLDNFIDEERYVGGYLVEKLDELSFRSWVMGFFEDCRQKYITVLEYVAECESRLWRQKQQQQHLEAAIRFYKECAYAATCPPADHKRGERALRAGIALLLESEDREAVQNFSDVYRNRAMRLSTAWTPEKETYRIFDSILPKRWSMCASVMNASPRRGSSLLCHVAFSNEFAHNDRRRCAVSCLENS